MSAKNWLIFDCSLKKWDEQKQRESFSLCKIESSKNVIKIEKSGVSKISERKDPKLSNIKKIYFYAVIEMLG